MSPRQYRPSCVGQCLQLSCEDNNDHNILYMYLCNHTIDSSPPKHSGRPLHRGSPPLPLQDSTNYTMQLFYRVTIAL